MTVTITFEGLLLTALAVLGMVLLVYLILLIKNLLVTVKKANTVLDDVKVVSSTVSDKTKTVEEIVDGLGDSVKTVVKSLKDNKSTISAATSIVNAFSNLFGQIKKIKEDDRKTEDKK